MSTSLENTSTTATNALAKAPGSVIPPHPEPPMPSAPDGTTTMLPASASLDAEPSGQTFYVDQQSKTSCSTWREEASKIYQNTISAKINTSEI